MFKNLTRTNSHCKKRNRVLRSLVKSENVLEDTKRNSLRKTGNTFKRFLYEEICWEIGEKQLENY